MTYRWKLLTDEERKTAEREGKREGKRDLLAKVIGIRFPSATPALIKQLLKPFKPFNDFYADELTAAALAASSLEELQKKARALIPAC